METSDVKRIIETLLFVTDQPLTLQIIKSILGSAAEGADIEQLIKEIGEDYTQRNSPMELRFIADGWQFSTKKEFVSWIRKLYREKTVLRLSTSALETLSIVAYKQPITRSEIEEIRGVEVTGVLETLLERKLVHIVGRKETLGRPLLYGTTTEFLRHFGLSHLSELPSLEELATQEEEDVVEITQVIGAEDEESQSAGAAPEEEKQDDVLKDEVQADEAPSDEVPADDAVPQESTPADSPDGSAEQQEPLSAEAPETSPEEKQEDNQ